MTINTSKTVFQLFTLSTKAPNINLYYDNSVLTESTISTYLGIDFDRRLSWKNQIEKYAEKASKRSRILKRLTATKWGANTDTLKKTYQSYIRPVLEYGNEVTVTATTTTTKKLEIVQNSALRIITGAPKSTPIAALEAQTRLTSIQVQREKSALCFWERCRRVYKHEWDNYHQATARLKTQTTPLTTYKALYDKYSIAPTEPALLHSHQMSFQNLPPACLSLKDHHRPEHLSHETEIRQAAIQTIMEDYPEPDWLHIYTDGSSLPNSGDTGAGFYSKSFEGHFAVGTPLTNYDGEVAAIHAAAAALQNMTHPSKAVFCIDSQAAIINLSHNSQCDCESTIECQKLLDTLITRGWTLQLQ